MSALRYEDVTDAWAVLDALRTAYPDGDVPVAHLDALGRQLEEQVATYRVIDEVEEGAIAIVKPEGWPEREVEGVTVRATEISYPVEREHLVFGPERMADNRAASASTTRPTTSIRDPKQTSSSACSGSSTFVLRTCRTCTSPAR